MNENIDIEPKKNELSKSYTASSGGSINVSSTKSELDVLYAHFEEKIEKINTRIENQKLTIIETIGIFVALFTFISIDFQVFKSYRNPFAVSGLSLILLGSISFLLIMFDFYILQARAINSKFKTSYENNNILSGLWERMKKHPARVCIMIVTMLLIIFGLLLFHNAKNEDFEDVKIEIKKEAAESVRNEVEIEIIKSSNEKTAIIENNSNSIKRDFDDVKKCIKNFGLTRKCFE